MAKAVSKRSGSAKSTAARKAPKKSAAAKSAAGKVAGAKKPAKKKKSPGMIEKIVDMVGDVRKNMAKRRKARRAKIADAFSSLTGQSKGTKKVARRTRAK